jgi:hypothetical protein
MNQDLTLEKIDQILEEISGYEVKLEEDPTLPELGNKYLQRILSQCRQYLNRVQYYLQLAKRTEKSLRSQVREYELDLDLKTNNLLADDQIVRKQPSIEDRKALAASQLIDEHENLAKLRVFLLNVEEGSKIIKHKYDHLRATNQDIRLQRNMVRDDIGPGDDGYQPPTKDRDGSVLGGLPPVVRSRIIDPKDILDPDKRPADLPEPVDAVHAQQIAEFYSRSQPEPIVQKSQSSDFEKPVSVDYSDLLK